MVYLPVGRETQLARIAYGQACRPDRTFPVTEAEADTWRAQFEEPDAAELDGGAPGGPPAGWPGWPEWAAARWPSLADRLKTGCDARRWRAVA